MKLEKSLNEIEGFIRFGESLLSSQILLIGTKIVITNVETNLTTLIDLYYTKELGVVVVSNNGEVIIDEWEISILEHEKLLKKPCKSIEWIPDIEGDFSKDVVIDMGYYRINGDLYYSTRSGIINRGLATEYNLRDKFYVRLEYSLVGDYE